MARERIAAQVEALARPIAARFGLEVADVELVGEGPRSVLRVLVEGPHGVTVEDCARVSEALSRQLDLHDPIPHAYTLEVASPGLDRPLRRDRDFQRFAGSLVEVRTVAPVEGQRTFRGRLLGLVEGQVVVHVGERTVRIPRAQVSQARLVVDEAAIKALLGEARQGGAGRHER